MIKKICFAALTIWSMTIHAGEVDNYLSWEKEIEDSYWHFNYFLDENIHKTLNEVNAIQSDVFDYKNCESVAYKIIFNLGTNYIGTAALNSEFERWVQKNKNIETYPVNTITNDEMRLLTMYGPKPSFLEQFFLQVDRVANVGGVYFGTDKISHFTGSGYLYFKNYLKAKNEGKSKLDSIKYAVQKGFIMEGGIIGIRSTGVFSYADQEANFQGMKMSINMCEGDNPYLSKIDGKWEINREVDFRDYVNPYWDESFNVSGYIPERVKKMGIMIKQNRYCELMESSWVLDKKYEYVNHLLNKKNISQDKNDEAVFSVELIDELLKTDREMQKLLRDNQIGTKQNYTLPALCKLIE